MPYVPIRLRAFGRSLGMSGCIAAALLVFDAPAAYARTIKMALPGLLARISFTEPVARKKACLGDLEIADGPVTGDAITIRVLLSGNADIGLISTLNVLASINAGASIRAVHSWQPIGDYSLVLA